MKSYRLHADNRSSRLDAGNVLLERPCAIACDDAQDFNVGCGAVDTFGKHHLNLLWWNKVEHAKA